MTTDANAAVPWLSVIIPCYNEQKNLEHGVLAEVSTYLASRPYLWEVIVVDDGSTDDSLALVKSFVADEPGFAVQAIPHGTKPAAIAEGIRRARGELVLFADMDQSTPIQELDKLLPWSSEFPVVIGSRGAEREGFTALRQAGSTVFRMLRATFLLRDVRDTQCGFKLFRREVLARLFGRLQFFRAAGAQVKGWKVTAYDVELLHLCRRAGYGIKEVTVAWRNRDLSDTKGQNGEAHRYLRESVDMVKQVLRVTLNQLRGYYDDL
ncbi:MAG: glycosyltransferase [Anaerolineae bacterium]|jgi:glycosyltransferase involved in cell wall biosynthesis|nr:glycosyltransferase [Anaerolineae bacterium]